MCILNDDFEGDEEENYSFIGHRETVKNSIVNGKA